MATTAATAVASLAASDTSGVLKQRLIKRRACEAHDVSIKIRFCGICHSDLHQLRGEWAIDNYYPMVPGHEIVGEVESVGAEVTKFKAGDRVGVGVFVDSCRECSSCRSGLEQYCLGCEGKKDSLHLTYNCCLEDRGKELLFGGYSRHITVDESYVLSLPHNIDMAAAAPLLCAGITMYSPLNHFQCLARGKDMKVGIHGFGGLGHMGVKLAKAMGCHVVVLSRGEAKKEAAGNLGAEFLNTNDAGQMTSNENTFDLILSTVSADFDINPYLDLLKLDGTYCLVGLPPNGIHVKPFNIATNRRSLTGSMIGGIKETQDMLQFCSENNIGASVQVIPAKDVNHAMVALAENRNEAKRFVIDIGATLDAETEVEDDPRIDPTAWQVHADAKVIPASARHWCHHPSMATQSRAN